ncbi:MAG: S24/S26 family peptidase [Clostridia bacterium]|nr:S24/S26 family peptidase [Clostridia bacterium]
MNKLSLELSISWELIKEAISSDGEFRLYPRGTSMMPLLREGIDSVLLKKPEGVSKNDIVLYKRSNGQFVLHRVIKIKNGEYVMCGDNQFRLEYGIREENLLARVSGFWRDDLFVDGENEEYKKYIKRLPKHRRKIKFKAAISKLKRIIFGKKNKAE